MIARGKAEWDDLFRGHVRGKKRGVEGERGGKAPIISSVIKFRERENERAGKSLLFLLLPGESIFSLCLVGPPKSLGSGATIQKRVARERERGKSSK